MSHEHVPASRIMTYWICPETTTSFMDEVQVMLDQLPQRGIPLCEDEDCLHYSEEMVLEGTLMVEY